MTCIETRRFTEEREEQLSPLAVKSRLSRGRARPEEPCPIRTSFQRDRDRILHSKSFRRLKHKTQVFIAPLGDHFVTRLTHTLEVAQIARTISRALNLNEDLTEAIALGHDLGHTPFGHVGEKVLNDVLPQGFRHNEQSLRVVDNLEKNGRGLNLTWEVRDGILNHSKTKVNELLGDDWGKVNTLEGEVCKLSDIIAYINHDVDDAIRAGIINENDLPRPAVAALGRRHSQRINTMVCDVIQQSWPVRTGECDLPKIKLSQHILDAANILREFLFVRVYDLEANRTESRRAGDIIRYLFYYYLRNEERLPLEYRSRSDSAPRRVADYVANMTDQYALRMAAELGR